jgi:hypothetical protein
MANSIEIKITNSIVLMHAYIQILNGDSIDMLKKSNNNINETLTLLC